MTKAEDKGERMEGAKTAYEQGLADLKSARRRLLRADELNGGEVASHILHNVMFFTEAALGCAEGKVHEEMPVKVGRD